MILNFSSFNLFFFGLHSYIKHFVSLSRIWLSFHKSWPVSSHKNYEEIILLSSLLLLLARFLSGTEFPIINCYLIQLFENIATCLIAGPKTVRKQPEKHIRMPKTHSLITNWFPNDNLTVNVWEYFLFHICNKRVAVRNGCI